jgi:hypothetical protein
VVEKNMDTTDTLLFVDIACLPAKYLKECPASAKLCGRKILAGTAASLLSYSAHADIHR